MLLMSAAALQVSVGRAYPCLYCLAVPYGARFGVLTHVGRVLAHVWGASGCLGHLAGGPRVPWAPSRGPGGHLAGDPVG